MEPNFPSQKLSAGEGLTLPDPVRARGDGAKQPSSAVAGLTTRAHLPRCPTTDTENEADSLQNHARCTEGNIYDSHSTTVSPTQTFVQEQHGNGFWKVFSDTICATCILFLFFLSLLLSLGIPYWYYRSYRLSDPSTTLSNVEEEGIESSSKIPNLERWNKILTRLTSQWKAFFAISAGACPAVFPMLAIFPDPKCSWASLLASLALFSGLTSMCIAKLFLLSAERFQEEAMVDDWDKASHSVWFCPSSQRFWLLVSLPTIWWSSQIAALVTAIIFGVWEQETTTPPEDVCLQLPLKHFKIIVLFWLWMVAAHFTFFVFTIKSLISRA